MAFQSLLMNVARTLYVCVEYLLKYPGRICSL